MKSSFLPCERGAARRGATLARFRLASGDMDFPTQLGLDETDLLELSLWDSSSSSVRSSQLSLSGTIGVLAFRFLTLETTSTSLEGLQILLKLGKIGVGVVDCSFNIRLGIVLLIFSEFLVFFDEKETI